MYFKFLLIKCQRLSEDNNILIQKNIWCQGDGSTSKGYLQASRPDGSSLLPWSKERTDPHKLFSDSHTHTVLCNPRPKKYKCLKKRKKNPIQTSRVQWHTLVILALDRVRQEECCNSQVSLGYVMSLYLKKDREDEEGKEREGRKNPLVPKSNPNCDDGQCK